MAQQVSEQAISFTTRPITDRKFLDDLLRLRWSGGSVLLRGKLLAIADVEALAAYDGEKLAGVATWRLEGKVVYLVTLNNITDQRGVGVALLDAVKALGRAKGAALMRCIVTNDNLNGLGFYQRRGFRIVAVYPGAVDTLRSLKPSIPAIGAHKIPMRDEIELEIDL